MVRMWSEERCAIAGCTREVVTRVALLIGGEPVATAWCGPHGAEYRVDEAIA